MTINIDIFMISKFFLLLLNNFFFRALNLKPLFQKMLCHKYTLHPSHPLSLISLYYCLPYSLLHITFCLLTLLLIYLSTPSCLPFSIWHHKNILYNILSKVRYNHSPDTKWLYYDGNLYKRHIFVTISLKLVLSCNVF